MYRLRVRESFPAGHYLPGHNGPCANQHGHTWTVEVEVSAKNVGSGGMVVDFADVKLALRNVVMGFDHRNLNDLPEFAITPPTAENLANVIYGKLSYEMNNSPASIRCDCDERIGERCPHPKHDTPDQAARRKPLANITAVTVWESDNASVTLEA